MVRRARQQAGALLCKLCIIITQHSLYGRREMMAVMIDGCCRWCIFVKCCKQRKVAQKRGSQTNN